ICQLREITERPDYRDRARRIELVEHGLEFAFCLRIAVSPEANGVLPRALDKVEDRLPFLLAKRISEDAAEQADIFPEGEFLVSRVHLLDRCVHASTRFFGLPRKVGQLASLQGASR